MSHFIEKDLRFNFMNNAKPLACLSLDLDNQWSYMKTHGDPGWKKYPSYIELLIPRILESIGSFNLKITFFIVGQDALLETNRKALAEIAKHGHDIGNHSFHHEPWLSSYPVSKIRKEIMDAERAILEATGQKPVGFRGPGFSWSEGLVSALAEMDYLYDASTLPTYLGPLARLYYFSKSGLSLEAKQKRRNLFGSVRDGRRPVRPYFWVLPSNQRLLEIPVTTVPALKLPFHLSYLLYLNRYSPLLVLNYLNTAIGLCRLFQTGLSFLLHPLDFLGCDEVPELAFFPGMTIPKEDKIRFFQRVIRRISRSFQIVDMRTYAKAALGQSQKLGLQPISQESRFLEQ
jgi:peptidoglycan/xylan/chitin deacetylase (PgdA/CDA1 family)